MSEERIIKSKSRVQLHGEVFTPKKIVNKMLNTPGIKEMTRDLSATFLEPSAGEGAFLVEILNRKLNYVRENYNNSIIQYENYSLYALSTIYGIELLEDNLSTCILNMYSIFYKNYIEVLDTYKKESKKKVLDSAKLIIKTNIIQGDFLNKINSRGEDLIFSEWKALSPLGKSRTIEISRIEYTLDEIRENREKENGIYLRAQKEDPLSNQLSMFDSEEDPNRPIYRFANCKITDVSRELMEKICQE